MNDFVTIGTTLLLSLFLSFAMKKAKLPQVIGHLLIGVVLGISGLQFFTETQLSYLQFIPELSMGMIGFMIGWELRWARLKKVGISILSITLFESILASLAVFIAIYLWTKNLPFSLIMGALAAATAPGGTTNIIQQYRARGPLTTTLFGVIGADDAFAIMIYAVLSNISKVLLSGTAMHAGSIITTSATEIGGSLLVGIAMGIPFLFFMERFKDEDSRFIFTFASIMICSGLALTYHLSLILANMALGITISNIKPHKSKPFFLTLFKISPMIYILFFVIVGAKLNLALLPKIGVIGCLYILFRIFGKVTGAYIGATLAKAPITVKNNLGICLLSQAGVAIGLAISAQHEINLLSSKLPESAILVAGYPMGNLIINVVTTSTLVFQVIGPILTKRGLEKAGEIRQPD